MRFVIILRIWLRRRGVAKWDVGMDVWDGRIHVWDVGIDTCLGFLEGATPSQILCGKCLYPALNYVGDGS